MKEMEFIRGQKFSDAAKVKNKWRFEWLKEKDGNGTIFSEWFKKIKEEGHCFCFVCSKKKYYGSNGKKALKKHAEDKVHQTNLRGLKCSISLL